MWLVLGSVAQKVTVTDLVPCTPMGLKDFERETTNQPTVLSSYAL